MDFAFRTAGRIMFGAERWREAPELAGRLGTRVLLVTGASSLERAGVLQALEDGLARSTAGWSRWIVSREPDVELADEGARRCMEIGCDAILAVGGGSVLDAAKAAAALATNGGTALEYLEDVPGGGRRRVEHAPLPLVCAPTTAGSGSEVTLNSVLRVPEQRVKRSLRSDLLVPRVALVDPTLTAGAPRGVAAAAGLDALTHLIEAYTSLGRQPITDALALRGIRAAIPALWALAEGRVTAETQEGLALASLLGGMALANAGLGAAHGLVAPLGGRCAVPHGAGCARLLSATIRVNVAALRARAADSPALVRYGEIAEIIVGVSGAAIEQAVEVLDQLRYALGIPSLGDHGVLPDDLPPIVAMSRGGSMKYNPITLTDHELMSILQSAMGSQAEKQASS